MKNWEELLSSGLLELYVLGETSEAESAYVQKMMGSHAEIAQEVHEIELALEEFAMTNAITPDPIIKPFLLAIIDYTERLKANEPISSPPLLNEKSTHADYQQWIDRVDMQLAGELDDVYAKIIAYTGACTTAIVWIKEMAPQEVHEYELEKFLILEGTCTIHIENQKHLLVPGDYLTIPLHANHWVEVTSDVPCKVILQRIAQH